MTVENPSAVGSLDNKLGVSAYPNPAVSGSSVYISIEKAVAEGEVSIAVTDLLGNEINTEFASVGGNEFSVSTDGLSTGVYLIKVTANNESGTVRIVVSE